MHTPGHLPASCDRSFGTRQFLLRPPACRTLSPTDLKSYAEPVNMWLRNPSRKIRRDFSSATPRFRKERRGGLFSGSDWFQIESVSSSHSFHLVRALRSESAQISLYRHTNLLSSLEPDNLRVTSLLCQQECPVEIPEQMLRCVRIGADDKGDLLLECAREQRQ